MTIEIGEPALRDGVLTVDVDAGGVTKYLRSGTFQARYQGVDLSSVERAALVLPVLGTVLTIAYATGEAVRVPEVDDRYADAADRLAGVWGALYPKFRSRKFRLLGSRVRIDPGEPRGALQLYSGGVDGLTTLIRNAADVRALLTVWGADIPLTRPEWWSSLNHKIDRTDITQSLPRVLVESNLKRFANNTSLIRDFIGAGEGTWWMRAQHGMALLGLTAPVAVARGHRQVLLASTHSHEFSVPWGSGPRTDDLVAWGGVTVCHDGFELTRQQKISGLIGPHVREGHRVDLAVCFNKNRAGESLNCGACEKCIRTGSGLLAAGIEPASVGLPMNPQALLDWRSALESGSRRLNSNEIFQWQDLQRNLGEDAVHLDPTHAAYVRWLRHFEFAAVQGGTALPQRSGSKLVRSFRRKFRKLAGKVTGR